MNQDLEKLYLVIQNNHIFTEKEICETCSVLCSRKQKWHWLLPEEAERLKYKMTIENKFGAFFFEGGKCPLLKNTHCSIYENRPLECRLSPLSLYCTNGKLFWINLIEISNAIQKFDPLIENKDFIKIRKFKIAGLPTQNF